MEPISSLYFAFVDFAIADCKLFDKTLKESCFIWPSQIDQTDILFMF